MTPFLVLNALSGLVFCAWLAGEKDRSTIAWVVLGAIFGIPAILAVGLAPSTKAERVPAPAEDWACRKCEMVNPARETKCSKCGTWRWAVE